MTRTAPTWLATWLTPAAAMASGEEGATNPFAGDVGSAIWTLVIFILVVIILGKFAWGPILNVLRKREDFIQDSLAQAKRDREGAEARLKEYEERLAGAEAAATKIVDESRREAENVKRTIEADAKREANAMIERAKREIGIATNTATRELYDLSGKLATEIASRIIRKELSPQEHERLIADSIEELSKSVGGNGSDRAKP
jgi:F-type H+-transporting ATPase subunit b